MPWERVMEAAEVRSEQKHSFMPRKTITDVTFALRRTEKVCRS